MTMRAHSRPSDVNAEAGEVLLDGPDGMAISFTPDAAEETSRRLHEASIAAKEQASTQTGATGEG